MAGVGTFALGTRSLGGSGAAAPAPEVSITSPTGTLTTGGPTVTVAWTFEGTQTGYRIEFLNDALSTTYYDSGWVFTDDQSVVVNLVENGVPVDSADVTVRVSAREGGSIGEDTEALDIRWGVVTCTIDDPADGAVLETSSLTVEWTFASTRSKTQGSFRVRLLTPAGGVLHDSGWTPGTDAEYEVPFVLSDGTSYKVGVQLANSEGARS